MSTLGSAPRRNASHLIKPLARKFFPFAIQKLLNTKNIPTKNIITTKVPPISHLPINRAKRLRPQAPGRMPPKDVIAMIGAEDVFPAEAECATAAVAVARIAAVIRDLLGKHVPKAPSQRAQWQNQALMPLLSAK